MDHFDHLWKMEYSENTASDIITLANTITSWLLCFHSSSVQSIHIIRCFTLKTVAMGSYLEVYSFSVISVNTFLTSHGLQSYFCLRGRRTTNVFPVGSCKHLFQIISKLKGSTKAQ